MISVVGVLSFFKPDGTPRFHRHNSNDRSNWETRREYRDGILSSGWIEAGAGPCGLAYLIVIERRAVSGVSHVGVHTLDSLPLSLLLSVSVRVCLYTHPCHLPQGGRSGRVVVIPNLGDDTSGDSTTYYVLAGATMIEAIYDAHQYAASSPQVIATTEDGKRLGAHTIGCLCL